MILPAILLTAAAATAVESDLAIGDRLFTQGKYDQVINLANRHLEALPLHDPARAQYLLMRATACTQIQDRDCAAQSIDEALPLAEAATDTHLIALAHRERGFLLWRLNRDRAGALREYDEALVLARSIRDWDLVLTTLSVSGNIFRHHGDAVPEEALRRYEEALEIAEREHFGTSHILKNIGDTYLVMGMHDRAQAALEQAVRESDRNDVAEVRWMARLDLAIIHRRADPVAAERYFSECLDLLEEQQSGVLLDAFRPGALASQMLFTNPYDEFIDFLLASNRPADAFLVAERQRARVFLETLSASRDGLISQLPKGYAAEERQAIAALRRAQSALRGATADDQARAARIREVEAAENKLTALRLRLAVEQPALAQERYPKLWNVRDLQTKLLRPDESLLSFYVAPKRSIAWLLTRDSLQTFILPSSDVVNAKALAAIKDFRNPVLKDPRAIAQLSQALAIERIGNALRQPHLVIVPHGILNDVPFEALLVSREHPLIERAATSYAPSASSLAFLRQTPRPSSHPVELIAVANPLVASSGIQRTRQFDLAHMNLLAPLPHTADEVRAVASLFGSGASVLEGALATRAELERRGFDRSRILHFATHGLIDESRPDRSGLLLTAAPPRDDGLLQVRDIYAMRLNADLVTLSACDTALGKEVTGEGIIGLTRAFFFAGAHSVVASLWDVEDASTAELMKRFYANIRRGDAVDVALQRAKLDLIHGGGATSAPFYWASFIASGDALSPIEPRRAQTSWPVIAVAVGGLAAMLAVLSARVRSFNAPPAHTDSSLRSE